MKNQRTLVALLRWMLFLGLSALALNSCGGGGGGGEQIAQEEGDWGNFDWDRGVWK